MVAPVFVPVPLWLLLLAFPAVPIVVTHGQTAFLVAGLLGAGLWLVPTRPVLAGVLLGLATIKPQFGLLLPIVLLLTGQWRTILAAVLTAALLAAASALLFGGEVWSGWLSASARAEEAMAAGAVGYAKMMSPSRRSSCWAPRHRLPIRCRRWWRW
ncbi:glycosyltransferase family 87 protein [Novosphingobium resinovorum]